MIDGQVLFLFWSPERLFPGNPAVSGITRTYWGLTFVDCYMVSTARPVGASGAVKSKGADNLVISDSFPM